MYLYSTLGTFTIDVDGINLFAVENRIPDKVNTIKSIVKAGNTEENCNALLGEFYSVCDDPTDPSKCKDANNQAYHLVSTVYI